MKINFEPARFLLWVVTLTMVLFAWLFVIFFMSGILMAIFQVKDSVTMVIYTFFSLPASIACSAYFVAKKRGLISAFIDANTGR